MANADLGVVGKRADVFGNEAYSTKILEYMSQGIPAVIPRTAIDAHYFSNTVVMFYEPGDPADMADKMVTVYSDAPLRGRLVSEAARCVEANRWELRQQDYLSLVDRLVGRADQPMPNRPLATPAE